MEAPLSPDISLRTLGPDDAARHWRLLSDELALLPSDGVAYPPYDIVPLAPMNKALTDGCAAVLLDMDGTLTTTEEFCCRALEVAMRDMMGKGGEAWPGLEPAVDHPAIIGYSGSDNIRYLQDRYGNWFDVLATSRAFLTAAHWVLGPDADPDSRVGLRGLLTRLGWSRVLDDCGFHEGDAGSMQRLLDELPPIPLEREEVLIPVALTIYAREYHTLLGRLEEEPPGALIAPMPGAAELLALVKGALGEEAGALAEMLGCPSAAARLTALGAHFAAHSAQTALVTSSTRFEVGHALGAVLRAARVAVDAWPVGEEARARVQACFAAEQACFDAVVPSSDHPPFACKPRRDPYALALRRLGIATDQLHRVIGFEDTAPGIIALRGAGVGCAVALPFEGTAAHDFSVASAVAHGGLPEVLCVHGLFMEIG